MIFRKRGMYIALSVALILSLLAGIGIYAASGNGERLALGSELTYYIKVNYDGIDKDGTVSSDSQIINVSSGIIEVKDKLPEGLTFKCFVENLTTQNPFFSASPRGSASGGVLHRNSN